MDILDDHFIFMKYKNNSKHFYSYKKVTNKTFFGNWTRDAKNISVVWLHVNSYV